MEKKCCDNCNNNNNNNKSNKNNKSNNNNNKSNNSNNATHNDNDNKNQAFVATPSDITALSAFAAVAVAVSEHNPYFHSHQSSLEFLDIPTTSRASFMSHSQGDDYNNGLNPQHNFSEVIDDETSTSGVLETYEISSSNSLPISGPDAAATDSVVAVADDSTSIQDSISHQVDDSDPDPDFYNNPRVSFILNDDDDDDVVDIDDDETEIEPEVLSDTDTNLTKALLALRGNDMTNVNSDVGIMSANDANIFLETPVIEDQLHHQADGCIDNIQIDYNEKAGNPKRLSDEFMLEDNAMEQSDHKKWKPDYVHVDSCNVDMLEAVELAPTNTGILKGIKSEQQILEKTSCSFETSHDRLMSVRLKKMSLGNTNKQDMSASAFGELSALPSSSQMAPSMADIASMDVIERRDFETEQRLTGGIILKSSSVMNRNLLNLSLIKPSLDAQQQQQAQTFEDSQLACSSVVCSNDDWPSSSNCRAVSSDSKCTYKDNSTPTSSRKFNNSRLSKSTAKINLCATLNHQTPISHLQLKIQQKKLGAMSALQGNKSTSSSSSISSSGAMEPSQYLSSDDGSVIHSNANSDDNSMSTSAANVFDEQEHLNSLSSQPTSSTSNLNAELIENGCSRTSALHPYPSNELTYDDGQPSTSSARCQYQSPTKGVRHVNASAQTNERYLSRIGVGVSIGNGISNGIANGVDDGIANGIGDGIDNDEIGCASIGNLSNLSTRNRRRADSTNQSQRSSSTDDVILVDVVPGDGEIRESAVIPEHGEFNAEDSWVDCDEENNCSDSEEVCTCQNSTISENSHGGSNTSLNDTNEVDIESFMGHTVSASHEQFLSSSSTSGLAVGFNSAHQQRKRKYNDGRFLDDYCVAVTSSGNFDGGTSSDYCRKRIAYDPTATPRTSQTQTMPNISTITASITPIAAASAALFGSAMLASSPISRRTSRSLIPTRDNPPPELQHWLTQFQCWSHAERLVAVDRLIDHCDPSQVRHMMKVIEPQFQRDFISLLPRELALSVLSYLEPKDLLRAAQTCRSWRFLCDDNLLWKEKCRKAQILTEPRSDRPKRGRAGNMPPIASPWKAAYMRQHIIEMNWRSRSIRKPKVLKGHDDHVITCLQFSGNRIVSGSDDNTLKVWSAVTGRCLRTLVGHTGGVWSSQMSGNIIISGSTDRTLKVWDLETGLCVHTLQGHTSTVRCMHLHGNKVVSGSRDATLRVWDIDEGSCLHVLVGHLAAVRCVQYDGKLIVSGAYDYMVKIWHPERQECLHTLQGHTNRVYSLQFDGVHVVSGSLDTSIRVWDAENGNCKHTLMGHQSLTSGMELRQNILVSGNADSTVKVWDITTGACLQTLSGPNKHQSAVTCLQFNSRFVVTSSDDGTVKLWDVKTGDFIRNLVALESGGSGGVVWRIRANDTKLICAVGSRNGTEETKLMVLDFDVEGACVKCS